MGLFSAIYKLGLACKRSCVKPQRLPAKVISVGNITLGGTGKTPAVIAIAEEAKKHGLTPCILTRGYKGKAKGPCFVKPVGAELCTCPGQPQSTDITPLTGQVSVCSGLDAGDEPALMADILKDVPIIKCGDRYKGGMFAIENFKSQISNSKLKTSVSELAPTINPSPVTHHPSLVFILDDGFQHWALYRDIDILLIDATNPFNNEKLFPEGRLREPLSSIKRAHIIVLTKTDAVNSKALSALVQEIRKYNPEAPVFNSSHKPSSLVDASGEISGFGKLKDREIYAFAGIANPEYFRDTLTSHRANISGFKSFRDHYLYKQSDVDKIISAAGRLDIITTEKDLVKLRDLRLPGNLFALRIEFAIEEEFYKEIFKEAETQRREMN